MQIINPMLKAGALAGDPLIKAARETRHLQRMTAARTEIKKFRLHQGDCPVGMVVSARAMEVNAWNKNARAYYAHQLTLGREMLPVLQWKEVGQDSEALVWRVKYQHNGREAEVLVSGLNKTIAKREAESMLSVAAVIKSVERDDDIEGAIQAARAMNGADLEDDE